MKIAALLEWVLSSLLLSLRVAPVFVFAPPFSLLRVPRLVRVLMALGLSACIGSSIGHQPMLAMPTLAAIIPAALHELLLGVLFVLVFQLLFSALYLAGRTLDIQAGFGLAAVIDPSSKAQMPLIGTLFAYAAGAIFFSLDGHIELLRLFAASVETIPLGTWSPPPSIAHLTIFASAIFLAGLGVAGIGILVLFLADLSIALVSRTAPQMNVLVLGFQVKTLATMLVLPACFGVGGVLLARMVRMTFEALPGLL